MCRGFYSRHVLQQQISLITSIQIFSYAHYSRVLDHSIRGQGDDSAR